MAIFRCKSCGGDLEITEGQTVCTCEYCGKEQTLPTVKDEDLQKLFNRANVLRMKSEFDKAADIYEKILQKSDSEAEAYWGLILCKYGIEYVEDPQTFKRIPTCHRASYDAVTADEDYHNAIKYADVVQRGIYEAEARAIDEIQRGIITLAQKEEPYDVFICYKETDESGKRTQDSVIANDIYYQLTQEGFKVFYAAITLEDKLGTEYEPYIFSALNSAKVMLSLGTKPEYFNAVWVKNEWSRFLKIMKKDRSKLLIPCYRDMDAYELPEEFAHLQAQDMSKIGFINDIVRGIKKVIDKGSAQSAESEITTQVPAYSSNVSALLKRGNMALEDHEWDKADAFFEEVLNQDAECSSAYLGKLLAKEKKTNFAEWLTMQKEKYARATLEHIEACKEDTEHINEMAKKMAIDVYLGEDKIRSQYKCNRIYNSSYSCRKNQKVKQQNELETERLLNRAKQYATGENKQQIKDALKEIEDVLDERIEKALEEDKNDIARVKAAYVNFVAEADKRVEELNKAAQKRREDDYQSIITKMKNMTDPSEYARASEAFLALGGYKDSAALVEKCQREIERLNTEKQLEKQRQEKIVEDLVNAAKRKTKMKKWGKILIVAATVCIILFVFWLTGIIF